MTTSNQLTPSSTLPGKHAEQKTSIVQQTEEITRLDPTSILRSDTKKQVADMLSGKDLEKGDKETLTSDQDTEEKRLENYIQNIQENYPFLQITPNEVLLFPSKLVSEGDFLKVVTKIFGVDWANSSKDWFYFKWVDSNIFYKACYGELRNITDGIRLADGIKAMEESRINLYRPIRTLFDKKTWKPTEAVYLFEKLFVTEQVPSDIPEMPSIEKEVLTALDFDEFFSYVWRKGIRYGIIEKGIRNAIEKKQYGNLVIAENLLPTEWKNAAIVDARKELRRDKSAKVTSDGRVHFDEFTVAFPKVKKGEVIFQKTPLVLGEPGRDIWWQIINPANQKDVDIQASVGEGVSVIVRDGIEVLIAEIDGYLTLDEKGGKKIASVSDHIVHKGSVSVRKTGNLRDMPVLLEIWWDVDSEREVEWKSIHIRGSVFWRRIVSTEGDIQITGTAQWGTIESKGNVFIEGGVVSRESIFAPNGTIRIDWNVEAGTVLMAKEVIVTWRISKSLVIADKVELAVASWVQVLGTVIQVQTVWKTHGSESIFVVELPNIQALAETVTRLETEISEAEDQISSLRVEMDDAKIIAQKPEDVLRFLGEMKKKRDGKIAFTAEEISRIRVTMPLLPFAKKVFEAQSQIRKLLEKSIALTGELEKAQQEIIDLKSQTGITLSEIRDEVDVVGVVKSLENRIEVMYAWNLNSFITRTENHVSLFTGATGQFIWKCE